MRIYIVNASIKPTFTLAILLIFKKGGNFFLSFILYLNMFVNFRTIQYYKTCNLLFYTLLSWTWHVPRKWMRTAITAITFPYFLTDKERCNPLDYFRMGIIEERTKGIFRIQLSIHDGAFLQKQLKAFGHWLFLQKRSIVDVRLGSK